MASGKAAHCTVKLEITQAGAQALFTSDEMRAAVEKKAAAYVARVADHAAPRVHTMPRNELFGYRMKKGQNTWMAVIHPTSAAGYNIARKYGLKNLYKKRLPARGDT